jgi:small subunit ribosomal protein S6
LETATRKLYEGMFLVDSALATADWEGVVSTIRTILERAEAEIVSLRKWDERKLVYDISGKSRGTYILSYFRAEGNRIRDIERDVQLSEKIMRALILNTEQMTPEDIEKETSAIKAEKDKGKPPFLSSTEDTGVEETVSAPTAVLRQQDVGDEGVQGTAERKSQEEGEVAEPQA